MNTLFKIYAIVLKNAREQLSYRLNFLLQTGTALMYSAIFFFVAEIFSGSGVAAALNRYGGDYFSFVLIGLAFSGYMNSGMGSFASALREEQTAGTLEAILATPTPLQLVLFARLIWDFIYDSFHLIIYFVFGIALLHAKYTGASLAAVPVALLLSLAAFASLGLISAAFILVFKRGDPLNAFLSFLTMLLGGVYYPVEVMPAALQKIAAFLPMTYTLRIVRDALIRGDSLSSLAPDFLKLAALCAALLPLSLLAFSAALRRARRDGSLSHY